MEGELDSREILSAAQFELAVKKLADSLSYGIDRSPFLGSGLEYAQSRMYQWGDPIRSIDWRITARTGKVHVKEYEASKRMPCYLLIDTSASMAVSSTWRSKYATAVQLAGGLAFAALDRASPVGMVALGTRELRIEPSLGASQVWQWLHKLRRFRLDEGTAFSRRLGELGPSLASRALIIVISDLHDEDALPGLKLLAQRHDCIVIQLQDPAEDKMRGAGFLRAREAETGRSFVTHGSRPGVNVEEHVRALRRSGVDHLRLQTDKPVIHPLRTFLRARGVLGRTAR